MSNFVEDCIMGRRLMIEIDEYVDEWLDGDSDISLHEFSGMSEQEYVLFVQDEAYLPLIITAHKMTTDIFSLIK